MSQDNELVSGARLYRIVHGWPMVFGVPVPVFFLGFLAAIVSTSLASMVGGSSWILPGFLAVLFAGLWIAVLATYRLDPAEVGAAVVRWRGELPEVVESFSPESAAPMPLSGNAEGGS
jgi:hypothetical protein